MRKQPGKVISIEIGRNGLDPQPNPPQPAQTQRKISNSPRRAAASIRHMYWIWSSKIARYQRVTPQAVDQQVIEAMHQRKAA